MAAYYNEFEPYAAQWLRNLIAANIIAPGEVDERSIEDVSPDDLKNFTQCHFFAGIGVWSYALRLAGWPDDRRIWTASCPCQPFSAAGKGSGFDDERHLWPSLQWLIEQCRPGEILGEQVASKDAEPWIDLVQADLEALGYAFGAVAFPSASVGAPHIRDRTYWLANTSSTGWVGGRSGKTGNGANEARIESERFCNAMRLGNTYNTRLPYGEPQAVVGTRGWDEGRTIVQPSGASSGLADHEYKGPCVGRPSSTKPCQRPIDVNLRPEIAHVSGIGRLADPHSNRRVETGRSIPEARGDGVIGNSGLIEREPSAGPTNGVWADADWLFCRDGKWRPVEPGTFPLANGVANRVGRLRAYGNAINAEQAKEFIKIAMEYLP